MIKNLVSDGERARLANVLCLAAIFLVLGAALGIGALALILRFHR